MNFKEFSDKINKIISNFERDRDEVIKGLEPEIIDFIQEQMRRGLDSNDLQIGELKSEDYASEKKHKGGKAPFGWVDLYDEGSFQEGLKVTLGNDVFNIFSSDFKNDKLEKKYGTSIFGLNDNNLEKIQNSAKEDYIKIIKNGL